MKYTIEKWLAEAKKRFGNDMANWKFICPACGHINVGEEFKSLNVDPNAMYCECIGRHTGKGSPVKGDTSGCNWAAYGLFGTLGEGNVVVTDNGEEV